MSREQSSLSQLVGQVDDNDAARIRVALYAGGTRLEGRLISEVAYRDTLTKIVQQGNAAPAAQAFHALTEYAIGKREENERRRRVRPHSQPPTAPEYAHLKEDGTGQIWCLPLAAVDAWSVISFDLDTGEEA